MKLTVVICTHNRANLLLTALNSINETPFPNEITLSIVVIANACTDETVNYLRKYQNEQKEKSLIHLLFSEEPIPGKSLALNRAISLCESDWLCLIDDDHKLDKDYFVSAINAIRTHPECTIFCGKIIPDWTGKEPAWVHDKSRYKITPYPIPYFDLGPNEIQISSNTSLPGGGNLIIRLDVFKRVGEFSTDLGPQGKSLFGGEDSDFIIRALNVHESIIYIPSIIQYHYVNRDHLRLIYLLVKSYQRNKSLTIATGSQTKTLPKYLWLKLIKYLINIITNPRPNALRFNLTKAAGILGQISGLIKKNA